MRSRPPAQRLATVLLVFLVAATLVRVWDRLRSPPTPPPPEPIERPDLALWEMPGCYAIRADGWEWGEAASDSAPTGPPAFLIPPARVRLLPDSTDEWRRARLTYRAIPLSGDHDARVADYLRWVVRADTLWILWSDGMAGGGVALRQVGDSLLGRARVFDRRRRLDGSAPAAAWRLDCYTLERARKRKTPHR